MRHVLAVRHVLAEGQGWVKEDRGLRISQICMASRSATYERNLRMSSHLSEAHFPVRWELGGLGVKVAWRSNDQNLCDAGA